MATRFTDNCLFVVALGGSGALLFDLPKELIDVVESVEMVDRLLRIWKRSKLLLFKLDIDIDLEGRFTLLLFLCKSSRCCSNSNEVIDFDDGGLGGPPLDGGAGALLFLLDLGGPVVVKVLMAGDVGLSPGVTQPDSELMLLSPALDCALMPSIWFLLCSISCRRIMSEVETDLLVALPTCTSATSLTP